MKINNGLLSYQLTKVGLPVVGVNNSGRIDYSRPITLAEQQLVDDIVAKHNPDSTIEIERKNDENGPLQQLSRVEITSDNILEVVRLMREIMLGE